MGKRNRIGIVLLAALLIWVGLAVACGGGDEEKTTPPNGTATPNGTGPAKRVTITIGNITALTGPISTLLASVNQALKDAVRYANETDFIPGVDLKVIEYDGQFDPAKDVPAYQWLKQNGANLMVTVETTPQLTLEPRVNEDHMLLVGVQAAREALEPPGWNFNTSFYNEQIGYSLLKFIADTDWDYQTKGPARVGIADWQLEMGNEIAQGLKAYCEAHPEQFTWAGSHFVQVGSFDWGAAVDALKDCDYVYAAQAQALVPFANAYLSGGGKAKFLGAEGHCSAIPMVDDARMWGKLDGMIVLKNSMWWGDQGDTIDLAKEMLYRYHAAEAESWMRETGYVAAGTNWWWIVQIIKKAADTAGTQNIDSQALYNAAESFSLTVDGVENWGNFSPTKRTFTNYSIFYRFDGANKTLVRISDWRLNPTEP